MDKIILLDKIKKGNFSKEQLTRWVQCLEGPSEIGLSPNTNKIGDVYMHPIFQHPYVLLKKSKHGWVCTLITSDEKCKEIVTPCKSRFYPDRYFTKVLLTVEEPIGRFMSVYDNPSQLKKIFNTLKLTFDE
jgi:hypothetical protein